jgi:seryl-tRNA synthetase
MLDINLFRTDPDVVRENIKKKFQEAKLPLVDEVIQLDKQVREAKNEGDTLRNRRNVLSKEIGALLGKGQQEEAQAAKARVNQIGEQLISLKEQEEELTEQLRKRLLIIPNLIADSVPLGRSDADNVELARFGDPVVPDFEVPYHIDIMEN